jgi:hypothetical protein
LHCHCQSTKSYSAERSTYYHVYVTQHYLFPKQRLPSWLISLAGFRQVLTPPLTMSKRSGECDQNNTITDHINNLFHTLKKLKAYFITTANSTQQWASTPGSVYLPTQSTPSPTSEQAARKPPRSTASTTRTQRPRIRRLGATSLPGLCITLRTPSLAFYHSGPAAKSCLAACESTVRM